MRNWLVDFDESPWTEDEEDFSDYRKALVDARESEEEYVIAVELPGVEKEDIEVNANENSVEIKVEKEDKKEVKNDEKGFYSYKKSFAGFYRRVPLPKNADFEKINAEYKNGVLKLRIPKLENEARKGRRIDVD